MPVHALLFISASHQGCFSKVEVKMSVQYMSFSAHADAKGIMQLIRYCEPRNVMLVHGEGGKMEFLAGKIKQEFNIDCFMPANGETVHIPTQPNIPVDMALSLLKRDAGKAGVNSALHSSKKPRMIHGALIMKDNSMRLVAPAVAMKEVGLTEHQIRFTSTITIQHGGTPTQTSETIYSMVKSRLKDLSIVHSSDGSISISDSVLLKVSGQADDDEKDVLVSWSYQDEDLGSYLLKLLQTNMPS